MPEKSELTHFTTIRNRNIVTDIENIRKMSLNLAEKSELNAPKDDSNDDLLQLMQLSGVVRLDDLIPQEAVLRLVDFIRWELKESITDVKNGKVKPLQRFSNMLSSANRWDLKIPLNNQIVMETMKTMFRSEGPLGQFMTSLVSGDGELFELAAFCTSSGASRQVVHADTLWSKQPALYTCAVALQDVTEDMGPTLFIPGNIMITRTSYLSTINRLNKIWRLRFRCIALSYLVLLSVTASLPQK